MELMALYRLAEQEGIPVDCFELRKRESLSLMDTDGSCYIAINPLFLDDSTDEKIKLAHELGHCETGSFYNQYATQDIRRKHENRADKWAIMKLVPRDELDAAVEAGYSDVWSLADYFGVSVEFMRKAICLYMHGNLNVEQYFDDYSHS